MTVTTMPNRSTAKPINEYIAKFPPQTQKVLKKLRALVRATAPGVTEKISYGIPTFDLSGHYLVYLAGWKKHIALYPVTAGVAAAFKKEIEPYWTGKGTLQFPLDKPIPADLIRRIVNSGPKRSPAHRRPAVGRRVRWSSDSALTRVDPTRRTGSCQTRAPRVSSTHRRGRDAQPCRYVVLQAVFDRAHRS